MLEIPGKFGQVMICFFIHGPLIERDHYASLNSPTPEAIQLTGDATFKM